MQKTYFISMLACNAKASTSKHTEILMYRAFCTIYTAILVMNEEQRITACKTAATQILNMLRSTPHEWRNYLQVARTLIAHLDATTLMTNASRTPEQTTILAILQRLAFMDADAGPVLDIACWCTQNWLVILQRDSQNLAALRGLGQAWLSRAQPALARIHRVDGSSSSNGSGGSASQRSMTAIEEERLAAQNAAEAERRVGSADYVEARGMLQPATEYFERAVAVASGQSALSGDLLATAAEAYISLGNVSSPRSNMREFRRAVQLLRAAAGVSGYALCAWLQRWLDDYGRFVD